MSNPYDASKAPGWKPNKTTTGYTGPYKYIGILNTEEEYKASKYIKEDDQVSKKLDDIIVEYFKKDGPSSSNIDFNAFIKTGPINDPYEYDPWKTTYPSPITWTTTTYPPQADEEYKKLLEEALRAADKVLWEVVNGHNAPKQFFYYGQAMGALIKYCNDKKIPIPFGPILTAEEEEEPVASDEIQWNDDGEAVVYAEDEKEIDTTL